MQRRVQGTMFDLKGVLGPCSKNLADSVAVPGPPLERLKNQHVQGALEQLDPTSIGFASGHALWKTFTQRASTSAKNPRGREETPAKHLEFLSEPPRLEQANAR